MCFSIFTAFILEAFILEYSLRGAPKLESAVEAKIKQLGLGIGMKPQKLTAPKTDEIELVGEEQLPEQDASAPRLTQPQEPQGEEGDSDSDTESIPDTAAESGLRFHLKKRSRKKVEVLLQQMFQAEIDQDDTGPEQLSENTQFTPPHRKLTLDTVG
nr:hypothetical protein BaRGS_023804 [Batillaria attramentaria]